MALFRKDLAKEEYGAVVGPEEGDALLSAAESQAATAPSSSSSSPIFDGIVLPLLAEFVGDMLFVFVGSLAVISGAPLPAVAIAHGFTIFILIATLGHISGGHLNPAVTLGVTMSDGLNWKLAPLYVIAQVSGGFVGSILALGSVGHTKFIDGDAGGQQPAVDVGNAFICEAGLTLLLVLCVLCTCVDETGKTHLAPLAVGSCVMVDICAGGPISGASMNPARSFGPALLNSFVGSNDSKAASLFRFHWIYWAGPLLGALVAVAIYRGFMADRKRRVLLNNDN